MKQILSKEILEVLLKSSKWSQSIIILDEVDSTNRYAKKIAKWGAKNGTIILTDRQTSGYGKDKREWWTGENDNIALSVLLKPNCFLEKINGICIPISLAIHKAIKELCNVTLQIKWPNDLLYQGKKIAGILCESEFTSNRIGTLIIGIGININSVPSNLSYKTDSLNNITKVEIDRNVLISNIINNLEAHILKWINQDKEEFLYQYNCYSVLKGTHIQLLHGNSRYEGILLQFESDGALKLYDIKNQVEHIFYSGDISLNTTIY